MAILVAFSRVSRAVAALVVSLALFHAAPARANIVFDFSGVCEQGCSGTASGVLTLADSYSFGADITAVDFISLTYSSSSRSFEILPTDDLYVKGGLNADGSLNSAGTLSIIPPFVFPFFQAKPDGFVAFTGLTSMDSGSTYTFTCIKIVTSPGGTDSGTVPEPSIWAMTVLGFAGLGLAGYRKLRRAAVISA